MKSKNRVKALLLVSMSLMLFGCVEEYKTTEIQAKVIEKDYDAPETVKKTVTENGKQVVKKSTKPAEYEVTVAYNGVEKEFDNKNLFNSVEEGQTVPMLYKEGFDKKGKLITRALVLKK